MNGIYGRKNQIIRQPFTLLTTTYPSQENAHIVLALFYCFLLLCFCVYAGFLATILLNIIDTYELDSAVSIIPWRFSHECLREIEIVFGNTS